MNALSGRIAAVPAQTWHEEVLEPQFRHDLEHLLPWYLAIEKVLLLEYQRMGLADAAQVTTVAAGLDRVTTATLRADPAGNMSDLAFAVERQVGADGPVFAAWHVDRSRNDLQATAALLSARESTVAAAEQLLAFGRAVADLADRTATLPMPGCTHLQPAQVITPGFYLMALGEETLAALRRLRSSWDDLDRCPLGAGALAGQELPWDRDRMARLLGFTRVQRHPLVAVASRGWAMSLAADLAGYGVALSRFATDLLAWGSGAYGWIDLPDELSGISSAMPQKKNFPILERIRGRCAHLSTYHLDLCLAQRGTPYANSVEVSKEATANLSPMFDALRSTLRLFTAVVTGLRFRADVLRAACEREYLGGFTLANLLTLRAGLPWRTAQVVAGRYVVAATERGLRPSQPDGALLAGLVDGHAHAGHPLDDPAGLLAEAFAVETALAREAVRPETLRGLAAAQRAEYGDHTRWWAQRRETTARTLAALDAHLGLAVR